LQAQVSAEPAATLQCNYSLIASNSGCCGYCCRSNQLPAAMLKNLAAAHCSKQLQTNPLCLHAGACAVAGGALLLSSLLLLLLLRQASPLGCWLCSAAALKWCICCSCPVLLHQPSPLCYCCRQCKLH
jgi:hypothetical protein